MEKKNRGFKGLVITVAVILFSVISFVVRVLINSISKEDFPWFTPAIIGVISVAIIGYSIYAIFFSKDSFYGKKRLEKKAKRIEEKTLKEMFEEKEKKGTVYKNRKINWILIALMILMSLSLVGGAFYWFEYRPTQIKKDCSFVKITIPEVEEVTAEESENSKIENKKCKEKVVSTGNCSDIDSSHSTAFDVDRFSKWADCESCDGEYPIKEMTSYQPERQEFRDAYDSEYENCLRRNGLL